MGSGVGSRWRRTPKPHVPIYARTVATVIAVKVRVSDSTESGQAHP